MSIFRKKKYITIQSDQVKENIPEKLWIKCNNCHEILYTKELDKNYIICYKCDFHLRMKAWERINIICEPDSFIEYDSELISGNPLDFPGYEEKLLKARENNDIKEAVVTGEGKINNFQVVLAVMDANFIMGSMGSVVGEKITRAIEAALEKQYPLIIFATSGGARMQEGMLSLMQMAKTSAALAKLDAAGGLYISVLTNPTTGGVTASFASLGDIIIAEPGALIGFTGPRVIEQTIKQKLPAGFQKAEFMKQRGLIDIIVPRNKIKNELKNILALHINSEVGACSS
ncbi:acetyl-CoA carboxylase, carboxyltransferase subunit beta [Peptococcaceae bacterium]|nr:acetyl-CoA carboxylase, carboxyltransferase subunit beta [Peptococcaceae bacterium]